MSPEDGRDGDGRPQIVVIAKEPVPGRVKTRLVPPLTPGEAATLAAAFEDTHRLRPTPIVLIGMDTPQVSPGLLVDAVSLLAGHDAVFGPAADGGFWLLGLRAPDPAMLLGVPMSEPATGEVQLRRLRKAGMSVALMPCLTDVDTITDAIEVAALVPGSRYAAALAGIGAPR